MILFPYKVFFHTDTEFRCYSFKRFLNSFLSSCLFSWAMWNVSRVGGSEVALDLCQSLLKCPLRRTQHQNESTKGREYMATANNAATIRAETQTGKKSSIRIVTFPLPLSHFDHFALKRCFENPQQTVPATHEVTSDLSPLRLAPERVVVTTHLSCWWWWDDGTPGLVLLLHRCVRRRRRRADEDCVHW